MSSRILTLAVTLALAGCAVEHGNPPARQGAAGADQLRGMAQQGGAPSGPMHQVFARLRDTVAVGVVRVSLSVLLAPEVDRSAQRATMQAVLDAQRRDDSTLAAIRVLGFFPPPSGHSTHPSGVAMVPSALLEWVPAEGWNAVSAGNAHAAHTTDVLFVSDLPNHKRMTGAGPAR
jgi:hypothetical protein